MRNAYLSRSVVVTGSNEELECRRHAKMEKAIEGVDHASAVIHLPVGKLGYPRTRDGSTHTKAADKKRGGPGMITKPGDQMLGVSDIKRFCVAPILLPTIRRIVAKAV